jgi:1-hydroxycarotenoid 3,4-desaturase
MRTPRVAVVGAGVAGLVAALELARRGADVQLFERAASPGGKMREIAVAGARIDAGPTVFTMRWIFDEIFAAAGTAIDAHLTLAPVETLARHAWSDRERLDLFADVARSADAIGAFAGAADARGYLSFCRDSRAVFETLDASFMRSERPNVTSLAGALGWRGLKDLGRANPFATMWSSLGGYFRDPRLRQLFGRYATYCGSSPFQAPAVLMLVAHAERAGVWLVEGGMHRLARVLAGLAIERGARLRYDCEVREILVAGGAATGVVLADGERIAADAVIANADVSALASGRFGAQAASAVDRVPPAGRSLSAITWTTKASTAGFPLLRHNVFFSGAYEAEFEAIFGRRKLPAAPTVYVCAQDRADSASAPPPGGERLLCLVNAPASGDAPSFTEAEIERCETATFRRLEECGLIIERNPEATCRTTPIEFDRLFPATGGALYGPASHGWRAAFQRPGSRTRIARLYMAGGSVHPGAGIPMAAISGRIAAARLIAECG